MKKKCLAMLLAVVLAVCLLPGTAFATHGATSGKCGDNVTYSYSNGILTIQGTGDMDDYYDTDRGYVPPPWSDYLEQIHTVNISGGVTHIGIYAFAKCLNLIRVTIPNSVTSIGGGAFTACMSLASVDIPNSVTTIGPEAFSYCVSLTSVTIPDSVTAIENEAFRSCNNLRSVDIPNRVTYMGYGAFSFCISLTSVTIPDSVTYIGERAFMDCSSLTGIHVMSGNPSYVSVDGVLFNADRTLLHTYPAGKSDLSYRIPGSVTAIGDWAFYNCTNLTSVTIPGSIAAIEGSAFSHCSNLTSATILDGVTSIGKFAFSDCSSLPYVAIPDSVTSIGEYAFFQCGNLTDVYYSGSEAQWKQISILVVVNDKTNPREPVMANYSNIFGTAAIHYNSTMPTTPTEPDSPTVTFTDVNESDWYYKEVQWAADDNITNGTGNGAFSPKSDCTHEQILTFLYRAERGGDTAASSEDMDAAIEWARGKGMINDSFNPKALCTRADAVNYIWQALGRQSGEAGSLDGFDDVDAGDSYADAVAWAVTNGVTEGTDSTHFTPDKVCNRGTIVTFLYRAYVEPLSK